LHAAAVLRLTGTDRAVAEIAAVAEHVASLTAAAAALNVRPELGEEGASAGNAVRVRLLDEQSAGEAQSSLAEIRAWSRSAFGHDEIPHIWRALAHQPKLLAATWRKDRLIMAPGALDEPVKTYAAFAVACFRQSEYWIAYYTRLLRARGGLDDRMLVELAGSVMHYVSFNTIAHGMRLDAPVAEITASDVGEGGRLEHIVPGVRRRVRPTSDSDT
jgi:alkylhydroperoxidase/carboxymuconolactone decarboxylase family protein YurZ